MESNWMELVLLLYDHRLSPNECFAFVPPPSITGEIDIDNIIVSNLGAMTAAMGETFRQTVGRAASDLRKNECAAPISTRPGVGGPLVAYAREQVARCREGERNCGTTSSRMAFLDRRCEAHVQNTRAVQIRTIVQRIRFSSCEEEPKEALPLS